MSWKVFLSVKKNRIEFSLTLILLSISLLSLAVFLQYAELREGVSLNDPVLNLFSPIDFTWFTFALIYLSLVIAIASLINQPLRLIIACQVYVLILAARILSMYLMPLNPPVDIIILNDPFVQLFGTGKILTKDLFFSGHTATLFLLSIVSPYKKLRFLFLAFTFLVALFVVAQHVHYTIDVAAAPFYVYACYKLALLIRNKIKLNDFQPAGY